MAEMLHIGAGFFAALDKYVQAASSAALEAFEEGQSALHKEIKQSAKDHPRWKDIADHIERWDDENGAYIGVRNPEVLDKAMDAEFGDKKHPPAPILRNTFVQAQKASERVDEVLSTRLSIPRYR